jgi:hypothetical protein
MKNPSWISSIGSMRQPLPRWFQTESGVSARFVQKSQTATISWVVAGVARSNLLQGSASATKFYARSKAYATSANLFIRLRHE